MHQKTSGVRKPNALLYYAAGFTAKYFYRIFYRHTVKNALPRGIKPPFLVVAGHSCWLDYLIVTASMLPVRMNFVGAYNFFRNKLLKPLLTLMGVISKYQFTSDIAAVKKMKGVIGRGGAVAIFPNGCLSNDGRPGGFAVHGIARLVKFLDVPVVAVKTDGGYFTRPRWTKKPRRGRLETSVWQIISREEIKSLSEGEIYDRVVRATAFDDYAWQRGRMVPYKGRRMAEGLEYVLYKCPKCKKEFTLRSAQNRLYCTACGNAARMNAYYLFEPESEDAVCFDGIDRWYDYQAGCIAQEIEDPDFALRAKIELKCAEPGKYGYQRLGHGVATLTRSAITYDGKVGDVEKSMVFPLKNIPMIPYAAGEYIEIACGAEISRFVFSDPREQIKWVMAVRQIRDRFYERER